MMDLARGYALAALCVLGACTHAAGAGDPDASPGTDALDGSPGTDAPTDAAPPIVPAHVWSHFNWPRAHGGTDLTIETELVRMIDATPAGEMIRGNFFILDDMRIATALNAAYDRGVTMRITLNGSAGNRAAAPARLVASHMGTSAGYCGGTDPTTGTVGCITSAIAGIAHIKFLTFSRTKAPDGVVYPDVVWFASYNAAGQSGNLDSNSSTSIYNAPVSYAALTTHQIRMQAQTHYPSNDYYDRASGRGYFYDPAAHVEVHLSPQHDSNLVLDQFARVTPDTGCVIRVFQALISNSMLPTINKLVALQAKVGGVRQGCQVFVLVDLIQPNALAALKAAGIEVRAVSGVHDKLFLIDGKFDGSATRRQLVFTGSHNWSTKSSYGNDELLASIEDPAQYAQFYAHFLDAWHAATGQ